MYRAVLFCPRIHVNGYIDFLVDTGADVTTLHPRDAIVMSVPYELFYPGSPIFGIGGVESTYEERAVIVFDDGQYMRFYALHLSIAQPKPENLALPSLLGQDILRHWNMVHDKSKDRLTFTARYSMLRMQGSMTELNPP